MNIMECYTAWFSSSTDPQFQALWTQNGGFLCDCETANFLFSADPDYPDTASLLTQENLTVFHPDFILDCIQKRNIRKVVAGRYQLLSQDSMRKILEAGLDPGALFHKRIIESRESRASVSSWLTSMFRSNKKVDTSQIPTTTGSMQLIQIKDYTVEINKLQDIMTD